MESNKGENTVTRLMDINNFAGAAEGRIGPWIKFLTIGLSPLLVIPYLLQFLPLLLVGSVFIIWNIIVLAYTVWDLPNKVARYKKQLEDPYATASDLLEVKTVHDLGIVEYMAGQISIFICAENGSIKDPEEYSIALERFNKKLVGNFITDYYFVNAEASSIFASRYRLAKNIIDLEARHEYIERLDFNLRLTSSRSKMLHTIYRISGRKEQYSDMLKTINAAINSSASKVYKKIYILDSAEELEKSFSRDLDSTISMEDLIIKKYSKDKFYNSRVLGYDLVDIRDINENNSIESSGEDENIDRGFLVHD